MLLCAASPQRPPFSINIFSFEEVGCILKYIHNSYVRHYKLYKYIFTKQVRTVHEFFCTSCFESLLPTIHFYSTPLS